MAIELLQLLQVVDVLLPFLNRHGHIVQVIPCIQRELFAGVNLFGLPRCRSRRHSGVFYQAGQMRKHRFIQGELLIGCHLIEQIDDCFMGALQRREDSVCRSG